MLGTNNSINDTVNEKVLVNTSDKIDSDKIISVDILENEENSDDLIDLSEVKNKIKSFFKSSKENKIDHKSVHYKNEDEGDEISLDLKKINSFFNKNSKWIIPLLLILIVIFISSYFRMMPLDLPITDSWAESTVHNFYKQQIASQIQQQYPNLPDQNKQSLAEKEFQSQLEQNKDQFEAQIAQLSQQYKSNFQDDSGQTYLLAIDPYLWFGEIRNYLENGHFGTDIVDGEEINFLRNGRLGRPGEPGSAFHLYFGVFLFKFISFFNKNISLLSVFFLLPVILIGLSIIPTFLIVRKIAGNIGGFFAGMIVAINWALLSRTPAGFSDTDPYNVLFPLLIVWMLFESLNSKNFKNRLIFGSLSGLICGLYSKTWTGWWYIFDFLLVFITVYIFYLIMINFLKTKDGLKLFLKSKKFKQVIYSSGIFLFTSAIFVTLFSDFKRFLLVFSGPSKVILLKEVALENLWPNVLTTVAEFNEVSFSLIISQMGGKLLFFIALLGIILTLIHKRGESKDFKYGILLIIWLIGTFYGFTKGSRFAILIVPAFAISAGICVGKSYYYLSSLMTKHLNLNKIISNVVLLSVVVLILLSPIQAANNVAKNELPSMNDAWFDALNKIKNNTLDAIITSWWDFGHWFVVIAERRVTFDGADQGERIHWVGKTLLTDNEQESVGILRMLNCGQEEAPHVLEEFFDGDIVKAINVLNEIMVLNDKNEAIQVLDNQGLSSLQISKLLELTYCDDLIDQFYITSEDMVGKAGVWGHFGAWDFEKSSMFFQIRDLNNFDAIDLLIKNFGFNENEASEIYYQIKTTDADRWISPWPGYYGQYSCSNEGGLLSCPVSISGSSTTIKINLENNNATIKNGDGVIYPNSLVYSINNSITEIKYLEDFLDVSVILLPNNKIVLSDPLQANSMFTKLFFFEGLGLNCFEKFDDRNQLTGDRIITWKVDFSCSLNDEVFSLETNVIDLSNSTINVSN